MATASIQEPPQVLVNGLVAINSGVVGPRGSWNSDCDAS